MLLFCMMQSWIEHCREHVITFIRLINKISLFIQNKHFVTRGPVNDKLGLDRVTFWCQEVTNFTAADFLGLNVFNTMRLRQNGCHFPDDTFKCIFMNENFWILIKISPKFVPKVPIDQSHRCGHRQVACCEPAGSYDKTTGTAICFEHKTQYLLISAPYTRIVVFWHVSKMPNAIGQSQISCNTPTFCIATIFVTYCYTTGSWLL